MALMTEDDFRDRLRFLRNERRISAREMSLDLGQNESYINKIETGKCSTSIASFLKICDYFTIQPKDFFNQSVQNTKTTDADILNFFHKLSPRQSEYVLALLQDLTEE